MTKHLPELEPRKHFLKSLLRYAYTLMELFIYFDHNQFFSEAKVPWLAQTSHKLLHTDAYVKVLCKTVYISLKVLQFT